MSGLRRKVPTFDREFPISWLCIWSLQPFCSIIHLNYSIPVNLGGSFHLKSLWDGGLKLSTGTHYQSLNKPLILSLPAYLPLHTSRHHSIHSNVAADVWGEMFQPNIWHTHCLSKERETLEELTEKNSIEILVEDTHHVPHNIRLPPSLALARNGTDKRWIGKQIYVSADRGSLCYPAQLLFS